MGRVITRAFMSFRKLTVLSLVTVGLFTVLPEVLLRVVVVSGYDVLDGHDIIITLLGFVIALIAIVGQTAITHAALRTQQGLAADIGTSLGAGANLFLPILGLGLLCSLGIFLGLILLVIPGLIVMTEWVVATPARIMSGPGISAAMSESAELTKGVRWQVFGLILITVLVLGGGSWAVSALGRFIPESAYWIVSNLISPAFSAFIVLYYAFGSAALYHELSWGADAGPVATTADVFD